MRRIVAFRIRTAEETADSDGRKQSNRCEIDRKREGKRKRGKWEKETERVKTACWTAGPGEYRFNCPDQAMPE
jgi:uncharacterized cupin superfamily protein